MLCTARDGRQNEELGGSGWTVNVPVHRPVERDGRAADGPLLEPLRVARLLVQVRHAPHQVGIDEDDVGLELLARLELDALGSAVLDRHALDGAVEAELGAALLGDLLERFRDAAEAAEGVEDAFAVLGVLEEVVSAEGVERRHALCQFTRVSGRTGLTATPQSRGTPNSRDTSKRR